MIDLAQLKYFSKEEVQRILLKKISGGELGALLQTKNKTIYSLKKNMDELAHNFVNNVNDIHRQGFKAEGLPDNLKGDQINFFQEIALNQMPRQEFISPMPSKMICKTSLLLFTQILQVTTKLR